jgi:succinate dehydrogenase/fumarate reductase cytochrome b subunit
MFLCSHTDVDYCYFYSAEQSHSPNIRSQTVRMKSLLLSIFCTQYVVLMLENSGVQTESFPASASAGILNKQRLSRPSSPHFTIYQPQLTWLGSIANRITGSGLSVRTYHLLLSLQFIADILFYRFRWLVLYGFSLAYLFAPGTFDSEHVVAFIGGLPDSVKYAGKVILAAPFAFHSWNGLRHLSWDMGKCTLSSRPYLVQWADTSDEFSLDSEGSLWNGLCCIGCHRRVNCRFGFHVNKMRILYQKCSFNNIVRISVSIHQMASV